MEQYSWCVLTTTVEARFKPSRQSNGSLALRGSGLRPILISYSASSCDLAEQYSRLLFIMPRPPKKDAGQNLGQLAGMAKRMPRYFQTWIV
jgi:hypothetical protein